MSVATPSAGFPQQYLFLEGASWDFYKRALELIGDRHLRVTYDRGRMEFMSPGPWHDQTKTFIGRLLETYATERKILMLPMGSTTYIHEELERGIEPDECYYVMTEPPPTENNKPLDLSTYPPPDLAVEVDATHSSIPRQPIYGAMGVPEVWRYDHERLTVLHRQADGSYAAAEKSLAFPHLNMAEFNRFLAMGTAVGTEKRAAQLAAILAMQDWAREQSM